MNLEFMCCILFGLTEIYLKPERNKLSNADAVYSLDDNLLNDNTITLLQRTASNITDRSTLGMKE
jgi:hypothetical protein